MKCPLFHAANMTHEDTILNDPEDCIQEKCAWWDKVTAKCYLVTISTDLIGKEAKDGKSLTGAN